MFSSPRISLKFCGTLDKLSPKVVLNLSNVSSNPTLLTLLRLSKIPRIFSASPELNADIISSKEPPSSFVKLSTSSLILASLNDFVMTSPAASKVPLASLSESNCTFVAAAAAGRELRIAATLLLIVLT